MSDVFYACVCVMYVCTYVEAGDDIFCACVIHVCAHVEAKD